MYSFLFVETDLFQTNQFCIKTNFKCQNCPVSTQFASIRPIDRTLSGATTPAQSGPGSDGNERVLCIPSTQAKLEPHH